MSLSLSPPFQVAELQALVRDAAAARVAELHAIGVERDVALDALHDSRRDMRRLQAAHAAELAAARAEAARERQDAEARHVGELDAARRAHAEELALTRQWLESEAAIASPARHIAYTSEPTAAASGPTPSGDGPTDPVRGPVGEPLPSTLARLVALEAPQQAARAAAAMEASRAESLAALRRAERLLGRGGPDACVSDGVLQLLPPRSQRAHVPAPPVHD